MTSIITSKQSITLPSLFSVPSTFLTNRGYSNGVVVSPFSRMKSLSIVEWVHPKLMRAVIINSFLESKVINLTLTLSSPCSFLYRFSRGFLSFFFFVFVVLVGTLDLCRNLYDFPNSGINTIFESSTILDSF
jgi:hypothetical protein